MAITAADLLRLVDTFDWQAWADRIRALLEPRYRAVALDQAQLDADALGLSWDAQDPFVEDWFTGYLGERITQIDETTRTAVRDVLQSALRDGVGESVTVLAARIRADVADAQVFSPARALTIARTEAAFAYNAGALLLFRQNGYTHVLVSDGDLDAACEAADGAVWTIEYALEHLLEHPNCVRSFKPAPAPGQE